jgi:hypothetical protein
MEVVVLCSSQKDIFTSNNGVQYETILIGKRQLSAGIVLNQRNNRISFLFLQSDSDSGRGC